MTRTQTITPSAVDGLTMGDLKDPNTPGLSIEVLSSGKKVWKYKRRVAAGGPLVRLSLGQFPAHTIAAAREWAGKLNDRQRSRVMDYFSTRELFQVRDHGVPLQTEHAIRGLMAPFESLFPNGRIPRDRSAALQCLDQEHSPKQPIVPLAKKDWIEWIFWEVKLRLGMAVRFLNFLGSVKADSRSPPIVLFLREFRSVRHKNQGGIGFDVTRGGEHTDVALRERIESMFADCSILWIANPRDALSYSFSKDVPDNSYPYFASQDWLGCVRVMARSADLIVMANRGHLRGATSSAGGTVQELELLREEGLLDNTFFSSPSEPEPYENQVRNVADLTRDHLKGSPSGRYEDILRLPPTEHWADIESSNYAAFYISAIDRFWGDIQDTGRKVSGAVFAALFTAMTVLTLFRGELAGAAGLQRTLVAAMQASPDRFHPFDRLAEGALQESADWYAARAKLFGKLYGIPFADQP